MQNKRRAACYIDAVSGVVFRCCDELNIAFLSDVDRLKSSVFMDYVNGLSVCSSTKNNYIRYFKLFLNYLVKNEIIQKNPLHLVSMINCGDEKIHFRSVMSDDEVKHFLSNLSPNSFGGVSSFGRSLMYRFALFFGLRYSEVARIQLSDIDFPGKCFCVRGVVATKNKSDCFYPLSGVFFEDLAKYYALRFPVVGLSGKLFPVIPRLSGAHFMRFDLASAKMPYRTEKGFIDFHALRKTCCTSLLKKGVPLTTVQKIMRHKKIAMTTNIYNFVSASDILDAVQKIDSCNSSCQDKK